MSPQILYNARVFQLPREFVLSLMELKTKKSIFALISTWIVLIAFVCLGRFGIPKQYFLLCYIPLVFLIAGRFGSLLQLIHEASHNLISKNRETNDRIATYLCALPVGVFYDGYVKGHMQHHAWTNTEKDPKADTEKYRVTDCRDPLLYLFLIKDLLGMTALSVFFTYKDCEDGEATQTNKLKSLMALASVQLVVFGLLFQFRLQDYLLFWLFPAISPHMFLMRIRGIAEHGLAKQIGVSVTDPSLGNFYTRSFFTAMNRYHFLPLIWLEKILIGSLGVNHHHEHHLFPTVPFYHLKALNARIGPLVKAQNPDVYAAGYFAAALRNLRAPAPLGVLETSTQGVH